MCLLLQNVQALVRRPNRKRGKKKEIDTESNHSVARKEIEINKQDTIIIIGGYLFTRIFFRLPTKAYKLQV